jgi:hypothetical protein
LSSLKGSHLKLASLLVNTNTNEAGSFILPWFQAFSPNSATSGAGLINELDNSIPLNTWTDLTETITEPATAGELVIHIQLGPTTGGTLYLDNVRIN